MLSTYSRHLQSWKTPVSVALVWINHSSTPTAQFKYRSYCISTKNSAFAANSNHHSNSTGLLISDRYIQVFKVSLERSLCQLTHPDRVAGREATLPPISQALSPCDLDVSPCYEMDNVKKMSPPSWKWSKAMECGTTGGCCGHEVMMEPWKTQMPMGIMTLVVGQARLQWQELAKANLPTPARKAAAKEKESCIWGTMGNVSWN